MAKSISISIQTTADLKGIQQVEKALQGIATAAGKAAGGSSAGGGLAKPLKDTGAAAAAAEKQILSLAQAQARLQQASGQGAQAEQTLTTALSKVNQESVAAIRAKTQLVGVQNKLSGQTQSLTGSFSNLGSQLGQLSSSAGGVAGAFSSLAGSLGTVGAAGAAIGLAKVTFDLAQAGANAELVRKRFDALAASAGTTGDALLKALRAGSGGEISDLNLELAANKAQLLGVANSAEQFGVLMNIARDRAQQMGITTTQAFDDLVTGLGRGSRLILDNLGILVNADQANQAYAASIGKTAAALTDQERKQALINQVLADGAATMAATGGAVESSATQIAKGQAAFENLKTAVGGLAAIRLGPLAEEVGQVVNALSGAGSFSEFASGAANLISNVNPAISVFKSLMEATDGTAAAIAKFVGIEIPDNYAPLRDSINQWLALMNMATGANSQVAASTQVVTDIEQHRADVTAASAAIVAQSTSAQLAYANSMELGAVQAAAAAMAAEQKAGADQVAAVDAQTHAVAQDQLTAAAISAARALLAAGGQGAATAATLAGSSQQVDVLTAAYYRLFAAQQAVGVAAAKAKARTDDFSERHGGVGAGGLTPGAQQRAGAEQKLNADIAAKKKAADVKAAKDELTLANGTSAQKIKIRQDEYNQAVAQHGAESVEAINAQSKLLQVTQQGAKAGGAAKVSAADAAGLKLEGIETKTGDKLSQIVQDTQAKIIAIDQKAAAERARIAQELNNKLAATAADRRASNEADDLDLIGVTDAKEAQKLNDRERAQAAAREREVAAAKEARDAIANGEAESASKVYDIREKQISDQQALDEKYAERQAELAGNEDQLAALKTQYDEATRANEEAAQVRIDIAKAESDQKKAEVQAEKDAVIAAANDQANEVVAAAERSAQGVTKATKAAKDAATANLHAIGDAVNAIPSQKTITISVNQQGEVGASSGGGGNKAAGGGHFMTAGPSTLRVGDNPGGRELVSVIPLSGSGTSHASGNLIALAGGGTVDAGGGYTTPVAGSDQNKKKGSSEKKEPKPPSLADQKKILDEQRNIVQMLMDMAKLKEQIAKLAGVPAFDIPVVQALINRAQEFTAYVKAHLIPITKKEVEGLDFYFKAAQGALNIIHDMADLKKDIAELKDIPAFDQPMVLALIDRAQQFTAAMQNKLIPLTEFESEQFSRYADAVSASTSVIKDVADLKKSLFTDYVSPTDDEINLLVNDAKRVAKGFMDAGTVMGKEGAEAGKAYAEGVGAAFSAAKEGMLVIAGLNSGDFVLKPGSLEQFESASLNILDTMKALGGAASSIPKGDIANLQTVSAAISSQSEALIKLAAVPFTDLPGASAGLAQSGGAMGGMGAITVNVYGAAGQDAAAIANIVIQKLNSQVGMRR